MNLKKYVICFNNKIPHSVKVKDTLAEILASHNIEAQIFDIDNLKTGSDFAFVIGGDGTILKAARFFAKHSTPIFGINLGRLGFLSQSPKENLAKSVLKILDGKFHVEEKIMLQSGENIALNDFVIMGNTLGRTALLSLKING